MAARQPAKPGQQQRRSAIRGAATSCDALRISSCLASAGPGHALGSSSGRVSERASAPCDRERWWRADCSDSSSGCGSESSTTGTAAARFGVSAPANGAAQGRALVLRQEEKGHRRRPRARLARGPMSCGSSGASANREAATGCNALRYILTALDTGYGSRAASASRGADCQVAGRAVAFAGRPGARHSGSFPGSGTDPS